MTYFLLSKVIGGLTEAKWHVCKVVYYMASISTEAWQFQSKHFTRLPFIFNTLVLG